MKQYMEEMDEIISQTACFVRGWEFNGEKGFHLHHDHKREENNIIGRACVRCNLSMTEERRSVIPVIPWSAMYFTVHGFFQKWFSLKSNPLF